MKIWVTTIISILILSFFLTYVIRIWALKYRIIDVPNERSSHSHPTPRGGGVAIVISWYTGITILFLSESLSPEIYFALLSGILLAIISLVDDIISIKPGIRLLIQFLSAALALYFLKGIDSIYIQQFYLNEDIILLPLALITIVWFVNLYNFLDGIDGYASIEAICISLVLYIFTNDALLLLLLVSVMGFLIWNWPRAKIFMGDVGSTQLGFILVILGIYYNNEHQFNFLLWILLSSPFWFDASLTLFRRWKRGEKLSQAHKKHAYQRLVQAGYSHLQVNYILIGLNVYLFIYILIIHRFPFLYIPLFILMIVQLYYFTRVVDKKVPFTSSDS